MIYDNELREQIADLCHEQWSGWMDYLFSKCVPLVGSGGDLIIPSEFVERWKRQSETRYSKLSEQERDSDRKEADKFLGLFSAHLRQKEKAR